MENLEIQLPDGELAKPKPVVERSPAEEDRGVLSPFDTISASDITLEGLLEKIPPENRDMIQQAYDLADHLHTGQTRKSGEPYIQHPLTVATYLADLNMDPHSVAAGLLHDVLEDTELTYEELAEQFPDPVPRIVKGVTKISKITFESSHEAQVENLRIMILAMAKDIRVVIVKLCDRLHNMQTLRFMSDDKRIKISQETLDIYAPLANRLGIFRIKSEMEDLAMRWIYPKEYHEISQKIARKRGERERLVQESIDYLHKHLSKHYKKLEIYGRPKHFFSIFRKMREQGLTLDQIYDLNAIRILLEGEVSCYEVLGLIHSIWPPLPGRIKDYIGMPKKNMYQSLHTTVIGLHGEVTEIQIRTRAMHQVAEYGIAAHWKYKEQRDSFALEDKLSWLRQLTEWVMDEKEPDNLLDALKKDVFADRVLCFTPQGDVIELPAEATPIDFAYAIHTQVGEHCIGARINRRMVNLRTKLQNGDVVEILTSTSGHPSRDWLKYVVTGRAKQKIKHWLKMKNTQDWVQGGMDALHRVLRDRNRSVTKEELEKALEDVLPVFKLQNVHDLLVEIGFGAIGPQAVLGRARPEWIEGPKRKPRAPRNRAVGPIIIQGMEGLPTRIAACCSPILGDPIVGFVTRGRGVTIHHDDCRNVAKMRENSNGEASRLLPASWNKEGNAAHTATIRVEAGDRGGLLSDLSSLITKRGIFINGCSTKSYPKRGTAVLRFEVTVNDVSQLKDIIDSAQSIDGVISAERITRPI